MDIPEDLKTAMKNKARDLSTFLVEGKTIGYKGAYQRLEKWTANFHGLVDDISILKEIISGLSYLSDVSIRDNVLSFISKHLNQIDEQNCFYTCLGNQIESSARIMSALNTMPYYYPNLRLCLQAIKSGGNTNQTIIFIDDFMNTGGQFESIIEKWFNLAPEDNKNHIKQRITLTPEEIELLQECELYFFFAKGMELGRERGHEVLREKKLNGKIRILEQYNDDVSKFGKHDTLERIRQGLEEPVKEQLFSSYKCSDVQKLLITCEEVGELLLRQIKPHWHELGKEYLYSQRCLGYGNSGQLDIGQNNIPTSSLTCLWAGGEIDYKGKTITWIPLFERREKTIGGTESAKFNPSQPISHDFNSFLNKNDKATSPYEIMLLDSISPLEMNLDDLEYQDVTDSYLRHLESGIRPFFENKIMPFKILAIAANSYGKFNNHLFYVPDPSLKLPCKIKSIHLIIIDDTYYISIRFSFKYQNLSIDHIRGINHSLPMLNSVNKSNIFSYNNAGQQISLKDLLLSVFATTENEPFQFEHSIIKRMVFVRTDSTLFGNSEKLEQTFSNLANFARNDKIPEKFSSFIDLDYECRIGFSDKGIFLLCGGAAPVNLNFNTEFYTQYYFLYLTALFFKKIKPKILIDSGYENAEFLKKLTKAYGTTDWFDNNHLLKFAILLKNEFELG